MNRYEIYLDRGRLHVLDLDTGTVFQVKKNGRKLFSSVADDEMCPYDIYRDSIGRLCIIHLTTGEVSTVTMDRV